MPEDRKIVLVGNPNVGKSVIFRLLTGSYVMVSNFPGTTVEVSRGRLRLPNDADRQERARPRLGRWH